MLTTFPNPALRRVEWVSDLVLLLRRSGRPQWVITPAEIALLDSAGLRWFVARGHWPAKFGQPAALWLAESGYELAMSLDGSRWRVLGLRAGALDPTAVEETGPVLERAVCLPSDVDRPLRWLALVSPDGVLIPAAADVPATTVPDVVPALTTSG